jgi:hypothetical protein
MSNLLILIFLILINFPPVYYNHYLEQGNYLHRKNGIGMGDVKGQHYLQALSQSNNGLKWSNSFDNMNEYGSLF